LDTEIRKSFSKCPVCGGKGRIQQEVDNEILNGKLDGKRRFALLILRTVIVNQNMKLITPTIEAPVIDSIIDFCSDCGCLFCIEYSKKVGVLEAAKPPPKPPMQGMNF